MVREEKEGEGDGSSEECSTVVVWCGRLKSRLCLFTQLWNTFLKERKKTHQKKRVVMYTHLLLRVCE